MKPVVIVGAGLAGITVARELRKLDPQRPLILVCADGGDFYSKPNLSNALAAGKTATQLVATPRATQAEQLRLEIRHRTQVTAIDAAGQRLLLGETAIDYESLVLGVGAQPIRLPLAGDARDEVLSVNHLDDYAVFREKLASARRIALLGAGLIGCEFANDLVTAGFVVDLIDLAPQPLGRLLPVEAGVYLKRRLEGAGVNFHLGASVQSVDRHARGLQLNLSTGDLVEADLVLSAVGLKPETALASAAGLKTNRGIVVDAFLATSDPHIHALGDCAEVCGLNLPYVLPLMQQARALAKTLAGTPTTVSYAALPVVVKTPACPTVVCPPPAGSSGKWREEVAADGVRAVFENDAGNPVGFALLGAAVSEKQALTARLPAWL